MRAVEEEKEGRFGHYQRLITPHQPCPTLFTALIGEHDHVRALFLFQSIQIHLMGDSSVLDS